MSSGANITLAQLLAFVTVVEEQQFTAAARKLGMTQSAVSQAVLSLEDALGVALLSRGRQGIAVSAIGLEVVEDAKRALRAVDRARERCADMAGLDRGVLRIGSIPSAATHLLPDHLRVFRARYPGIQVSLLEGSNDEVCEWVLRGAVDIGLTPRCEDELHGEAIAKDEFVAVVGREHRLAAAQATSVEALADEPFLMSSGYEPPIYTLFAETEKGAPQVSFAVRDCTALFEMIRLGLGITITPSLCVPDDRTDLCILALRPVRYRTLLAVTQKAPTKPAIAAFLAVLQQNASKASNGKVHHRAAALAASFHQER